MTAQRPLALVTGGSAGIGYALARQAAQHGHDVIITGAGPRVHESADRLADATGVTVTPVQSDLRTADGVDQVWAAVTSTGQPLAIAMLNAGVSLGGAAFIDTDLDDELNEINLNVISQVRLAKPIARDMAARRTGRILFTSSLSATTPTPYETVYGPTRAFVYSFAQSLRQELLDTGVTVTALLPGATATEFHERAGMGGTRFGDNSWKNDPELVARKGFAGLMAGRDHVIGGDRATWRAAIRQRILPERIKAAQFAKSSKPA
ncbi:SDR family NAD(P)-dependent oxidoreductase [Actinoplanes sichuanensis]|uniref:SDR family NAD(P)-dependent oxidoreductase n=1 Tax=Actinoplanes sichuanensis TaxID=512349 RepID=A0ABW4A2B6_9ACTN|nr:SDR family NAD(P)-dependent oxidoreductase [Actinoplanes sichuanensis]BEL12871.1 SDR family NAD(P)-dependent oxidoreductase [Actinoplanes sichuanensis]